LVGSIVDVTSSRSGESKGLMRRSRSRKLLVAGLVGLAVLGVTAVPAWGQEDQPIEVSATSSATDRTLEDLGYGVAISYRLGAVDTVVVRYRGGPDDPLLANRQIVEAVWQHEPYRFVRLDVEPVAGTSSSFTYDELAALLGPRPAGLDAGSLDAYEANVRATGPAVELMADNLIRGFVILVSVLGGGLFLIGACIALGGWAASKPRLRQTAPIR
jgi:hypothetical protein